MQTLDLLSQVLFVGLMAMLLFVLYKRFVRMLSADRIEGRYAHVSECRSEGAGRCRVVLDAPDAGQCTVRWAGGEATFDYPAGRHEEWLTVGEEVPAEFQFTFHNQVIRRRVA